MRRKLFRVGMAWRLLGALILALCLIPISSSPAVALSADDYFEISYDVEFSKVEIEGSEVFNATITVTATRNNNDFPLNLSPSEALITGRIIAEHQATGAKVTLNSSYTVEINPFPQKGETAQESEVVALQFPEESQSGIYSVVGELIKAEVTVLGIAIPATEYLPSSQIIGSVTYVAPDGGGGGGGGFVPAPTPTAGEVKTNLFGTEASSPISSSGEILEKIEATSEDEYVTITIEAGTIALDIEGEPLETLTAAVDPSPPEPPEDTYLIGAYDFGPDGATFYPPLTLTWSYDPETLPEDVDLVIAYYDEVNEEWVWVPCEVDTENNTITASIEHFTTFAIMGMVTSALESEPEVPVAVFRISELDISLGEVGIGQIVTIHALVWNTTYLKVKTGTYTLVLKINGVVEETRTVEIDNTIKTLGLDAPSPGIWVAFTISKDIAGTYSVDVNGLTDSFTVKEEEEEAVAIPTPPTSPPAEETSSPPPAEETSPPPPSKEINWPVVCGVVAAVIAMGSLLFFLARRSHTKSSS